MNAKINSAEQCETFEIYLSEDKFPLAYQTKLDELMENGMTDEEARKFLLETPFVMELVCHKNLGIFAVESDAIECTEIYSPYDASVCDVESDD